MSIGTYHNQIICIHGIFKHTCTFCVPFIPFGTIVSFTHNAPFTHKPVVSKSVVSKHPKKYEHKRCKEHGNIQNRCKLCGFGFCKEHGNRKDRCKPCGKGHCKEHGKRKDCCGECKKQKGLKESEGTTSGIKRIRDVSDDEKSTKFSRLDNIPMGSF